VSSVAKLPQQSPLLLTPREAAALDRLLNAYVCTEEGDPGLEDLRAVRRKLIRLAQDHTAYRKPATTEPKPPRPTAVKGTGKVRLTGKQLELLADVTNKPAMYITRYSRWDRTATSLIDHGLAKSRWCEGGQYELTATDEGRSEATRRGLVREPASTAP
jgi:hypothetical protein